MVTITGQAHLNKIEAEWYVRQRLFIQHLQETLIIENVNAKIQVWANYLVVTFRNHKKIDMGVKKLIEDRWSITENKMDIGEDQFNYSYNVKFK